MFSFFVGAGVGIMDGLVRPHHNGFDLIAIFFGAALPTAAVAFIPALALRSLWRAIVARGRS
jgi:putative effector of murein hydrolase LrgA (UPF0299 family)